MNQNDIRRPRKLPHLAIGAIGALFVGLAAFSLGSPKSVSAAPPGPTTSVTFQIGTASNQPPGSLNQGGIHPPSGACFYNEWSKEFYDFFNFTKPDTNYLDAILSVWQVPTSGCTQWAGHNFGDTQVETAYYLGSAVDRFIVNNNYPLNVFGYAQGEFGGPPPDNKTYQTKTPWGTIHGNGACTYRNEGWSNINGVTCQAVWASGTTLSGVDGDTTAYYSSPIGVETCPFGGLSLINVSNYAPAVLYDNVGDTEYVGSQIELTAQGGGLNYYYNLPNIYFDKPGGDCSG